MPNVKGLYCIYDDVAKECNAPFLANNDAHARLQYDMALKSAESSGYKTEYKLLSVALIDLSTGKIIVEPTQPVDVTFTLKVEDDE